MTHFGYERISKTPEFASAKRPLLRAVLARQLYGGDVSIFTERSVVQAHQPLAQGVQRGLGAVGYLELCQ